MQGKLYVVGVPIGNDKDLSTRALDTLKSVDFIAAEDVRVTVKFLENLDINKELVSYYSHDIRTQGENIIKRILSGESAAIVSDAGMPCISDPGEDLIELCEKNNIEAVVVPGPSAIISALCVSGLATGRFSFEGFLSTNRKNRLNHLSEIKNMKHTLVFYEANRKLKNTLQDFYSVLGNRKITIANDLTKKTENIIRTNLADALKIFEDKNPKGEFVLLVEGSKDEL